MAEGQPTNGAIDRRVERLEASHLEMQRTVDRLEVGQANLKEVMGLRFSGIEAAIATSDVRMAGVSEKIDGINRYLQNAITESAKMMGDVNSTPAGRLIKAELEELERGRESNANRIALMERRVYTAAGAISVVIILANLLTPLILRSLHLN